MATTASRCCPETPTRPPQIRRGYVAATKALGLPDDQLSPLKRQCVGAFDTFEQDADRLLNLIESEGVRAAIAHDDNDAINLLHRLQAQGVRVPGDFAIITYDDEVATLADLPLTSVVPARQAIGETAMRLLLRHLNDLKSSHWHVELTPDLRVRESCGSRLPTS
ncbi:substrate-binding domain-containing protein [Streptomyces pathocidini]|uniref:substrate-binding domain-containing protein n=1 Tax=Streptomyces pathocidini TaxID=1650571 RepID=UPI0033C211E6